MARLRIMTWNGIPAQVAVTGPDGKTARAMLPDRFGEAIDAAAMASGSADSSSYLDGWSWSLDEERPGDAHALLQATVQELDQAYPHERLQAMILASRGRG
jgi:hypothetical protein